VANHEIHAGSEHPDCEYDRRCLGDTDAAVALDDAQQLQQLGSVEQADHTQEP